MKRIKHTEEYKMFKKLCYLVDDLQYESERMSSSGVETLEAIDGWLQKRLGQIARTTEPCEDCGGKGTRQ